MKLTVYHPDKSTAHDTTVDDRIFGVRPNPDLLHQVVRSLQLNLRTPIAHAKDRAEVSGGGKKPWRQKGTGRARHGSIRSPLWRHGGVTHGPLSERTFTTKVSDTMGRGALRVALSSKAKEGTLWIITDDAAAQCATTKSAQKLFDAFLKNGKRRERALFVCPFADAESRRGIRNLQNVYWLPPSGLAVLAVVQRRHIIMTERALAVCSEALGKRLK
jgi:large subunit ribosomal protein L4